MVVRRRISQDTPTLFFVTTTVIDWNPIFADRYLAEIALTELAKTASLSTASLVAYVIMPSHVHFMIGLKNGNLLSRFMQTFKSITAKRILDENSPLVSAMLSSRTIWKPRFDDLVVWSEKQFRIKMEYIHNNPVKAGLVSCPTDYEFSSAIDWLLDRPGRVAVEKRWKWTRDS